jgi:hypothetical protein
MDPCIYIIALGVGFVLVLVVWMMDRNHPR